MAYRVHRIGPGDWEPYREVRLAMLRDAPEAFGERWADAAALPEAEWRDRAARQSWPATIGVAAVTPDGDWVGLAGGYVVSRLAYDGEFRTAVPVAKVVSVWVDPAHRGRAAGAAELLLGTVTGWAREQPGVGLALLEVHEGNGRARAFYERLGYAPTGGERPYPLDPAARLLELGLDLHPAPVPGSGA
ncbi:GNAT family N-acetyltransferase [Kitasatospora terrestris]|uniref:GNAT family N-acetyltransferase n=1 Tax=Kitasatospora terrestris TaxID=258051 RepID=UPI0031ED512F